MTASKLGQQHHAASGVRADKWLWAARFYKVRNMASDAIKAGHVDINGERGKPAKLLHPGDIIHIRKDHLQWTITVTALAEKRGSASIAATLYHESALSMQQRAQQLAQQKSNTLHAPSPDKRPDKRQRRQISQFKAGR